LIINPFSKISGNSYQNQSCVIIINALDECEEEEDIKLLITLLFRLKTLQSPRLRVLLTSRPELLMRLSFKTVNREYQDFVLHEIAEPVIERDITLFVKYELNRIRDNYNCSVPEERQLPVTWPSQADIQILGKMAVPLFIFAATACRFITDHKQGTPDLKLATVLKKSNEKPGVET
jgi:hypothetical protein